MTVIVNADDFGMYDSANRGILYSIKEKLINSVSVCVNYETSQKLIDIMSYRNQLLSIGLHVNLTEGCSLISKIKYPSSLSLYTERRSYNFYFEEIESQVREFESIYKILPEHIDCHQHFIYFDENAFKAFTNIASKYDIPIRSTYTFSNEERLEAFFLYVFEKHGIKVPFEVEKIVRNINYSKVRERSKYLALSLNGNLVNLEKNDLEIVCHPQISKTGEKNDDLEFMEHELLNFFDP